MKLVMAFEQPGLQACAAGAAGALRGQPAGRRAAARPAPLRALYRAVSRHCRAVAALAAPPQAPAARAAAAQAAQDALRAATALAAALALHLGAAPSAAHASAAEDALLQLVRQVDAKVGSALEAVKDATTLVSRVRRRSSGAWEACTGGSTGLSPTAVPCHTIPPPSCLPPAGCAVRARFRRGAAASGGGVRGGRGEFQRHALGGRL